ncbi:MAG: hypothetical protein JXR49_21435 [Acidobacteria bacterium]|nr:hypothetical protein [Acidobacteriota bacterium]
MKSRFKVSVKNQVAILFLLTFTFSAAPAVHGKDFWEKEAYKEWSKKDCSKMLENSPWAEKYEVTSIDVNSADFTASDGAPPYVRYRVQLRSALPIREAMVRQTQIANNYDDLSAEQQKAIDEKTDPFLNSDYEDFVVVYITYESNLPRNVITQLVNHWQTQNTDMLKFSVFLGGSKGEKVPLQQYVVSQTAEQFIQFVFPRKVNGRELLQPEDKELILEFPVPSVGRVGGGKAFVEFKTKKMMYNDKLEY